MKFKKRQCWADRTDATLIRGLDSMHVIMPLMMKNRADNEAFIQESFDTTALDRYLEEKNAGNPEHRYTIFQAMLAAVGRTIQMRPKMNSFICGERYYQREGISFSFVAKKVFSDSSDETIAILDYDTDDTRSSMEQMHEKLCTFLYDARQNDKTDDTTNTLDTMVKMPFFMVRFVINTLHWLDRHGWMPKGLLKEDPYASTVFLSNIGSLKMRAGYHHLSNWGTNSLFILIGEKMNAPVFDEKGGYEMKPTIEIGITLDERIADGYYYAKTVRILKHLLTHPELLDEPCNREVEVNV